MEVFNDKMGQINHIICRRADLANQASNRTNLCPNEAFLQLGLIRSGTRTYGAHFHIDRQTSQPIIRAQESWVVVQGSVEVTLYDRDNSIQAVRVLHSGDVTLTLYGGHGYRILEDETLVYEFKSGPYEGPSTDKQQIES